VSPAVELASYYFKKTVRKSLQFKTTVYNPFSLTKEKTMDTVYPDTKEGVIDCLKEMSNLTANDFKHARYIPDPEVQGVWKVDCSATVKHEDHTLIVYLAGYPNPWGNIRKMNDFE
jgi:hypothetical protein